MDCFLFVQQAVAQVVELNLPIHKLARHWEFQNLVNWGVANRRRFPQFFLHGFLHRFPQSISEWNVSQSTKNANVFLKNKLQLCDQCIFE